MDKGSVSVYLCYTTKEHDVSGEWARASYFWKVWDLRFMCWVAMVFLLKKGFGWANRKVQIHGNCRRWGRFWGLWGFRGGCEEGVWLVWSVRRTKSWSWLRVEVVSDIKRGWRDFWRMGEKVQFLILSPNWGVLLVKVRFAFFLASEAFWSRRPFLVKIWWPLLRPQISFYFLIIWFRKIGYYVSWYWCFLTFATNFST